MRILEHFCQTWWSLLISAYSDSSIFWFRTSVFFLAEKFVLPIISLISLMDQRLESYPENSIISILAVIFALSIYSPSKYLWSGVQAYNLRGCFRVSKRPDWQQTLLSRRFLLGKRVFLPNLCLQIPPGSRLRTSCLPLKSLWVKVNANSTLRQWDKQLCFLYFPYFSRHDLWSILYLLWRHVTKLCAGICRFMWEKLFFLCCTANQMATSTIFCPQITLSVTSYIIITFKGLVTICDSAHLLFLGTLFSLLNFWLVFHENNPINWNEAKWYIGQNMRWWV